MHLSLPALAAQETLSRVAVVGCGHRFRSAIEPTLTAMGVRAVLVVEPDRAARRRAVSGLGRGTAVAAQMLTTELLREMRPDAVIIASPSGLHFEHVDMSLRCGLPTFVEKPAAGTAISAQKLRSYGCGLLVVAEQRRYRRDLQLVRSFIEMGELGEIERIVYRDSVAPTPDFRSTWRNDPGLACGGVLLDLGYHTVGAVQWLLSGTVGDFVITSARLDTGGLRVETRAEANGRWGDTEVELEIGLDAARPHEELRVTGNRGEVRVERDRTNSGSSNIYLRKSGAGSCRMNIVLGSHYDAKSLRDFMRVGPDVSGLTHHAATLRFIDQIYLCAGNELRNSSTCR